MKKENEKKRGSSGKLLVFIILLLIATGGFFVWRYFKKSEVPSVFGKLEIASGNAECVIPKEKFTVTIRAVNDKGTPFKNCRITAHAPGSSCTISPLTALTDAGGVARFDLTAGNIPGDNYVKFIPGKDENKCLELRFVNGIKLIGAGQEGQSGKQLSNPVGIKLTDAKGAPRAGIRVYATASNGAELGENILTTDSNGIAETSVTLPEKSGASTIDFEIDPASGAEKFRTVTLQVMSFNIWNITVSVLGGLALFMLGMTMMSDGLNNIAGEKMKSILGYCTSNRFVALLAGAGITAVIQSSSATTVMIIGFVNAGLMNLAQSIGVIFGANIGTTITAQIIAFNVGALALPAIIVGLVMRFIKRGKVPEAGLTVLGFGLLFFGMNMMSSELKTLSNFPSFLKFFQLLDCAPIDGVMPFGSLMGTILIGVMATLIMQSSSATTGIVVVLGAGGLIDLYTAVALILGANIGTTVTAQLAAIPANRPARQAALAHTLFNVIGVVIIVASFWIPWGNTGIPAFFYLVNSLTEGNAFAPIPENMARHIANAHTVFNIVTAVVLLPFAGLLAAVCEKLMPVTQAKIHFQYLEPHLLDSPALALRQSVVAIGKMLKKSWKMVDSAVIGNFVPGKVNENRMEKFYSREERVDRYQTEIMEYLAQIMQRKISTKQAELIPALMHCANDAERIADRAENIITLTRRLEIDNLTISNSASNELERIFSELSKQTTFALNALEFSEPEWQERAIKAEKTINKLASESEENHIKRMKNGKCTAQTGIIYVELLAELVAVSRHLSNIAERAF